MSRWKPRQKSPCAHGRARRSQITVEALEDRSLLDASGLIGPAFDPGHILLQLKGGAVQKIAVEAGQSAESLVATYQGLDNVEYAELDYTVGIALTPDDPSFNQLYGLHNTGQTGGTADADIDAPAAWDYTTGGLGTVVGIIDTGIDYTHPDLYLNVWINQEEIPTAIRAALTDTDGDALITFWDLNKPINQGLGKITDRNANGRIDGGDLLYTTAQGGWADGIDQDPYVVEGVTKNRIDDLVGWNFVTNTNNPYDDHSHGTHVAGTIGAIGNNNVGVAGVNWKVQMAGLKFLAANGSGTISAAQDALDYAVGNGIKISNNSWGGGGFSATFSNALTRARTANHVFVAAAGNDSSNNDSYPSYPASYTHDNILAVASTDHNDTLSWFSNYGAASVDIAAPGSDIVSTVPGGYASYSGTSMATPHAAGVVALVRNLRPTWTPAQVISHIKGKVDVKSSLNGLVLTGGRLNAFNAVKDIANPPVDTTGPTVTSATPNATTTTGFSSVLLTFNEAINASSFTTADVTNLPTDWTASSIEQVSSTQFRVHFAFSAQRSAGTYTYRIGPGITDTAGNNMDQDGSAGSNDWYSGSVTLVVPDTTKPRVSSMTTNSNVTTSFANVLVTFDEAINAGTFTTADVTNLPNGWTASSITQVSSTQYRVNFTFTTARNATTYNFRIGPNIADLAGNNMDQDGSAGNNDWYNASVTLTAPVDTTGPRVTSRTVNASTTTGFNSMTLTFSEAILDGTFTTTDVVNLPNGWTASSVTKLSSTQYRINFTFTTARNATTYTFRVGPNITDLAGNIMDQNGDGTKGDNYLASVTLTAPDTRGPRVTSAVANDTTTTGFNSVLLTFNETINANSFTTADITNLSSGLTVSSVTRLNNTQFRVNFNPVTAAGTYSYRVGPNITDTAGNQMDQDNNGVKGDPFNGSFTLTAPAPGYEYTSDGEVPISDWDVTMATMDVPDSFIITDLNVTITLSHTWMADLNIYLIAPDGMTYAGLAWGRGGSGSGYVNTTFNDEATTPIGYGSAPFTGSFQPEEPLSYFDGLNAQGMWTLYIDDTLPMDEGMLHSWTLTFNSGSGLGGGRSVTGAAPMSGAVVPSLAAFTPLPASSQSPALTAEIVPFLNGRQTPPVVFSEGQARVETPLLRFAPPPLPVAGPTSAAAPWMAAVGGSGAGESLDAILAVFTAPAEDADAETDDTVIDE